MMGVSSDDVAVQRLGRYTLFGEIAAGGMATVSFGRLSGEAGFAKTVAIKRLHPQFARDEEFRQMFVEEARLAARIRHPNVVQTLDVVADGGELFLVMEYVHGESLSRLLKAARARGAAHAPSPKIAAAVLSGVLHGLHTAHEAKSDHGEPLNLVHRDVSPQNILVGVDGTARVIDFGIAKAKSSAQTTRDGEVRGKLPYLAPEQLGTTPATRQTDIYAASVVLWEMLAGKRLFEADDERAIYVQIIAGAKNRPSDYREGVPPALDAAVMRGLARNPNARFETARDMALAIEEASPLATPSQVGAWVEDLARDALADRARRLTRVESVMSTVNVAALDRASTPPPAPRSVRPPPSVRPRQNPREPSTGLPPPDIDPLAVSAPPPALALPLPLSSTTHSAVDPPAKRSRGGGAIVALGLLLVLSVGAYAGVPALVERSLAGRAKERGFVLGIGDVGTSLREIRLRNVTLTTPEMPGLRLSAATVSLELHGLSIARVSVPEADLVVDGAATTTLASLEKIARAQPDTAHPLPDGIDVANLRLRWSHPFGDATQLVVENAHVEVARAEGRPLGQDLTASIPLLKLETPLGVFGPYAGTLARDPESLHGHLRLDATGAANVDATLGADGAAAVQIDTSPLTLAELGVPGGIGGGAKLLGTARWAVPRPGMVDAKLDVTLRGISLGDATSELRIEAEAAGDSRRPLALANAAVTIDGLRALAQGTLDATAGVRVEARARGGKRTCPGAEPATIDTELAFDSRRPEDARAKLTRLGRCGPKRGAP